MKNLLRMLSVAAVIAAIVMTSSSTTRAFSLLTRGQKWNPGVVTVHLELGGGSGTLTDGATSWGQVMEAGMSIWNAVLSSSSLSAVRDSTAAKGDGNGTNEVFFAADIYGRAFGATTLAVTTNWFSVATPTRRVEADIIFNTAFSWNSYRGRLVSGVRDFRRVAIHELGHLLGLDHPDDAGQTVSAIMNAFISDIDTLTADDIAGVQSLYGAGVTGNVSFPARNEQADFYINTLVPLYRDVLRAALSGTYVDPEGLVIWLAEYARQRVGQCDHSASTQRTLAQIAGTGGTLVCGLTPAGAIAFAPRDQALLFMNELENAYRTTLGRAQGSSYVNAEGAVVWVLEYLRYRLNACGHGDAAQKVVTQIRGGGIQPTCR
jgi:hypothetical protein